MAPQHRLVKFSDVDTLSDTSSTECGVNPFTENFFAICYLLHPCLSSSDLSHICIPHFRTKTVLHPSYIMSHCLIFGASTLTWVGKIRKRESEMHAHGSYRYQSYTTRMPSAYRYIAHGTAYVQSQNTNPQFLLLTLISSHLTSTIPS